MRHLSLWRAVLWNWRSHGGIKNYSCMGNYFTWFGTCTQKFQSYILPEGIFQTGWHHIPEDLILRTVLYCHVIFAECRITEWQHRSVFTHGVLRSLTPLITPLQQWTATRSFASSCEVCKRHISVLVQANYFSGGGWVTLLLFLLLLLLLLL